MQKMDKSVKQKHAYYYSFMLKLQFRAKSHEKNWQCYYRIGDQKGHVTFCSFYIFFILINQAAVKLFIIADSFQD